MHNSHIVQVRSLLDSLVLIPSTESEGHFRFFSTLLIGHLKYAGVQRISCWPFAKRMLRKSNRQDLVFIRPPGIAPGTFRLSMDNVWFCRVLMLFSFVAMSDRGRQQHDCAFVSVLEEYTGRRRPDWLVQANSTMIYERKSHQQVLYVVPIASILSRLPVVPVGDTGTIPYSMRAETAEFPGASCDSRQDAGDGCRWWYVNSWAMTWSATM